MLREFTTCVLLLFALCSISSQNQLATGEIFDTELYNSLPLKAPVSTRSLLPTRVNLEPYCPTPGNQGSYMTCAAWSSAYHFRTIIEAKQQGITDRAIIDQMTYSPTWVYEILKDTLDQSCSGGLTTARSLLVFKELGVPSYKTLPFQCLSGDQASRFAQLDPLMLEAAEAKIRDLQILYLAKEGIDTAEKIRAIKKVLAEGYPVLISHTLYDSFHSGGEVWNTLPGEDEASDSHGSHAMVIVGYDDEKYGGAFRYLNSWGPEWGDGGFIWVPYETTGKLCYGAYQAFPFELNEPTEEPEPVAARLPAGGLQFVLRDGTPMPFSRTSSRNPVVERNTPDHQAISAYRTARSYASGTRFRFYLDVENEAYVYAFATDLSGKINTIFPYNDQVSPLVGTNSLIAFPADDKVVRLDNNPGTDYLLVLFCSEPLSEDELAQSIQNASGSLIDKVKASLKDDLIDPSQVEYASDRVAFSVREGALGTVVPLLLEIDHR